MCGISGIFSPDRTAVLNAARAMNAAQRHRGPDDEGIEAIDAPGGTLALAHRRLSIIDLSPAGHQPMTNPETGDWIVFVGEIFNFLELRTELERLGDTFRSRTDTEVILKAFARWGEASFEKLYGMFALALYVRARNELIVVRDPLGIKPLYFTWRGDTFAFASEVRALHAAGLVAGDIDLRAVAGMLAYGAVQEPLTMFKSVSSLEPGTWAAVDLSRAGKAGFARRGRHWDFPGIREPEGGEGEAIEKLQHALSQAARSHLISDVPVGIFLSSGLDSTAVAALCSQARENLNAFSVRLSGQPEMDESAEAAQSARALGLNHHIIEIPENAVRDRAQDWLSAQDQPSMDGLNTYVISRAVRERGMVVALSGLGGDEIFGGYPSFRDVPKMIRWKRRTRMFSPRLLGLAAHAAYLGKSFAQRRKAIETAATEPTVPAMFFRRRRLLTDQELVHLGFDARQLGLTPEFIPPESEPERGLPAHDTAAAISILEARFYMRSTLLRDSDVCSMAHGLELRVPLLDRRVIDCALALPGVMRVPPRNGGPNKPLLVKALGGKLPPHITHLKKRGFNLSQSAWMTGPLRDFFEHALSTLKRSGWVNPAAVSRIWEHFHAGSKGPDWARSWTLGVLGAWAAHIDPQLQGSDIPNAPIVSASE
jgi:asparagine synthase (glutamine-hydrolysing)